LKTPILILGIILISAVAQGQMDRFMLLEKPGKIKSRIRYYSGDEITWKYADEQVFYSEIISSINDSSFVTSSGVIVRYDELLTLQRTSPWAGFKSITSMAIYAIPPILVFTAANNLFNTGDRPLIGEEAWVVSGAFASVGILGLLIPNTKNYRLDKRWRLIPVIH
jgi:hypothetical protein